MDDNVILDSRLGFFCQPDAVKIFLQVSYEESARRIFAANRDTDSYASVEEVLAVNKQRDKEDSQRYLDLYNVDHLDTSLYDIVIDTTDLSPEEVIVQILAQLPTKTQ